jgi:hypothetical protein
MSSEYTAGFVNFAYKYSLLIQNMLELPLLI